MVYVSATPAYRERNLAPDNVVEMIVRPTGLLDPVCFVRPATGQVEDALREAKLAIQVGQRVLITTLTKRSAEDLTSFLQEQHVQAKYLHADIDTLERSELLRDLRLGVFDVLVGINLLREGLDLPEVALVLVLDADREGFLRSETSLIQTCGRAARNVDGRVVFYADKQTAALKAALDEAERRRTIQRAYNEKHGIQPQTIRKRIVDSLSSMLGNGDESDSADSARTPEQIESRLAAVKTEMLRAASALDFEGAIRQRDEVRRLEALQLELGV